MRTSLFAVVLALPLLALGCAVDESDLPEGEGDTESAITGTVNEGDQYVTTARLNLREGPSTSDEIQYTLALNTTVTIVDGTPENGFYHVTANGDDGYVFGSYLKSGATKTKTATPANTTSSSGSTAKATTTNKAPTGQIETCKASFYSEGQLVAKPGERFDPNALTAAHKTLPFDTIVRVTNTANGKTVDVRINDRGPFVTGRCIDLSRAAFADIASLSAGVASVKVEVLK